ncbi:Uncharacterised protein [uncultured archaeon]|nr:Uncharacterised protein [uncultured archaeon]
MELKEKAKFVKWNNEERREYYSVVARSFKSKERKPNLLLFDIKDFKT